MKATANEHGVFWAPSKSGKVSIAVAPDKNRPGEWQVWGLYRGTHDLIPGTRQFTGPAAERDARAYGNQLWKTR